MMHALTYGTFEVLRPQGGVIAPELDDYISAFLVGVTVNVVVAFALVCLANTTRAQRWYPVTVGVMTALVGAATGGSALLLALDINPVSFLLPL